MKVEDLPPVLAEAVAFHTAIASEYGYDTPEGAFDCCLEASDAFLHTLDKFGFREGTGPRFLREYILYPQNEDERTKQKRDRDLELFPFNGDSWAYHFVNKVDGFIIDWTSRQFDPDSPFPAIWREP